VSGATDTDVATVRAIAAGDREALARLYDRHAGMLVAIAHRILRNLPEAEDVVHDVFVEVWGAAASYDPRRAGVRAWLAMRARSRALDRYRSAARSRTGPLDEAKALPQLDKAARDPADLRAVRDELAKLTEEQQQVLQLGYFEGLSSSQIAERVGVPIGTVKSRVSSAFERLRRALRQPRRVSS
jgi:RNA polymerase sigma-70 factor (ECF subfamily)